MMLFSLLVLLGCSMLSVVQAHLIELLPASKECFFEDLHIGDQVSSVTSRL